MALRPCCLPPASSGGLARPASSHCGDGLRAKADLSLNAKMKPVADPVSLSILACNYCLPRYLQVFHIDGVRDGNVLEAGRSVCKWDVGEAGKSPCLSISRSEGRGEL